MYKDLFKRPTDLFGFMEDYLDLSIPIGLIWIEGSGIKPPVALLGGTRFLELGD